MSRLLFAARSLFVCLSFTLICATVSAAQQTEPSRAITGKVVDPSGAGLANVRVSIPELRIETRTGPNGDFSFGTVPQGDYTVVIRREGYSGTAVQHVRPGTEIRTTTLLRPAVTVDPVTVTASRTASMPGSSVLPVSQLNEDQLRRDATISLAHSLIRLPGVRSLSTGEQIGKPMIRGFSGSRVLVLQDGSRLEDYSWSEEDAPSIDARLAQRVEVIRGPASVLYGSDALGGVVNVIPHDLPVASSGSFTRLGGEIYGASNNKEAGASLSAEGARGKLGWRATGIGRFAEAFTTPVGEVENTGFLSVNGELAGALRGDRSTTTLRFSHYGGEFKLLEARPLGNVPDVSGEEEEEGPERKLADDRLQLVNDIALGGIRLETKAQYQRHSLVEVSDDLCNIQPAACAGASSSDPKERTAFDLLLNTGTADVLAHHTLGGRVRGVAGVSGLLQKNDSRGPILLVPAATTVSGAAFGFEEAQFGIATIAAGARIDTRTTSEDRALVGASGSNDHTYTEPSGNLGVVIRATPMLSFTANAGTAWRAPNLFELFANGPHLAEGRYEIGDRSLKAEQSVNLDAGIRWQSPRAHFEVDGFRNNVDRFTYITPTNEFQQNLRVFRHLQGDARLTGGEAFGEVEAVPHLLLRAKHDFVRGTLTKTDEPLPLMPAPRTTVGAEWRFENQTLGPAFVSGEVENTARQNRPNSRDLVTSGYTLLNFDLGVHYRLLGRATRIDLGVRNATNKSYRNFLSRYKEFALEPGRNLILRISTE